MQYQGRPPSRPMTSADLVATGAVLTALALIFSYIESLFPLPIGIPGVKLGIANLVILVVLYRYGFKVAMMVNILRIIIAGLLFTGVFSMLYGLAGGVLSLLVMAGLKKTDRFSIIGVSFSGGVVHNFAQVSVAAFLVSHSGMFAYFPVLLFSGLVAGTILGIVAHIILVKLP